VHGWWVIGGVGFVVVVVVRFGWVSWGNFGLESSVESLEGTRIVGRRLFRWFLF
jgi:hypothetical protein